MLATILIVLGIAAVIVNGAGGWQSSRPTHPSIRAVKRQRRLIIATGSLSVVILLLNGSEWLVQHFSSQPNLNCFAHFESFTNIPGCTTYGISVDPSERMKSLHLIIHFSQRINDSVLMKKVVDAGVGTQAWPRPKIAAPCMILTKAADRDNALTFQVSSDRHELIVNGHDFSKYDAQSFVVTFDPSAEDGFRSGRVDIRGEATYEKLGKLLKADLKLTDPLNNQSVDLTEDKTGYSFWTVRGIRTYFERSDGSFLLTLLGIAAVAINSILAWPSDSRKKSQSKSTVTADLWRIGSVFVAISILLITGSTYVEQLISPTAVVLCSITRNWKDDLPNCTYLVVMVVPPVPLSEFHMIVTLPYPVHDSVVLSGDVPGENFRIDAAPVVGPPCNLPDKPTGRNESLTYSVSSDGRQVIANGHDVTPYDAQSFIAGFYPDPSRGKALKDLPVTGEATYYAYGHELPANIEILSITNGKVSTTRLMR